MFTNFFILNGPPAGIHALARVASLGSHWHAVAAMASDPDELVRVGALRAMGRMAEPGGGWGGLGGAGQLLLVIFCG